MSGFPGRPEVPTHAGSDEEPGGADQAQPAPIGYVIIRKLIDGHEVHAVENDHERAPHVRFACAAYRPGAYTLGTLTGALADRGLLTRPTPSRPAEPLSRSQLAATLSNRYCIGTVRYVASSTSETTSRRSTAGPSRAQALLAAHGHAEERDRKHEHFFKCPLGCGRFGLRMSRILAKGNGGRFPHCFCIGHMPRNGCAQPYTPVERVKQSVERLCADRAGVLTAKRDATGTRRTSGASSSTSTGSEGVHRRALRDARLALPRSWA